MTRKKNLRKKREPFVMLYDHRGHLEKWIPCGHFGRLYGKSRVTVWRWIRDGVIPGAEFRSDNGFICLVPKRRAIAALKKHNPRLKQRLHSA